MIFFCSLKGEINIQVWLLNLYLPAFIFFFFISNDYLNVSEPTLRAVFTVMEGYNKTLEHRERTTPESPFGSSKHTASFDHQIVLPKNPPLKWKLNFLGRPKLLNRKEGEGEKKEAKAKGTTKKDVENEANWIREQKCASCPFVTITEENLSRSSGITTEIVGVLAQTQRGKLDKQQVELVLHLFCLGIYFLILREYN